MEFGKKPGTILIYFSLARFFFPVYERKILGAIEMVG